MTELLDACSRSLAKDDWVQSQASSCGIFGAQYGNRTGTSISPSTSVFPYRNHSTNAPCSFILHKRYIHAETDSLVK